MGDKVSMSDADAAREAVLDKIVKRLNIVILIMVLAALVKYLCS